jgi:hypothetical protein
VTDPLAAWWAHQILIRRWVGNDGYVDLYDPPTGSTPTPVLGFVRDGTKLVVGTGGKTLTSSAQVALPAGTAYVPVNSEVTLPAQFGSRTSVVLVASVGDGGGQPTPDHIELALL